jgi:superfamily I DNA/RNA helicase
VHVLTIHAAKGLEFAHVVVARFNEDCLPLVSSRGHGGEDDGGGQLDEERRLAYVAATRACSSLALTYVNRIDGAQMRRSHFLDAVVKLGPDVVCRSQAYDVRPHDSWPRLSLGHAQHRLPGAAAAPGGPAAGPLVRERQG